LIERYLATLERELADRGVRGRSARRVLAEARDHLLELEERHGSIDRFGSSDRVAREVAAQLATTRTIRSAYGSFAALATAGTAFLAILLAIDLGGGWPDIFAGDHEGAGVLAVPGLVLFPQLAFVAGCLGLLRALRLRGRGVLPAEELSVIRARTAVALAASAVTVVSAAVWAVEFRNAPPLAWWVPWAVVALCSVSAVPLIAGGLAVARSSGPESISGGAAGDLFDDLGFRLDPWRFAGLVAAVVGIAAFAQGWYAEGDPGRGLVHGSAEVIAVLTCFALLGRRLALRV
jgi:hypothetical protein